LKIIALIDDLAVIRRILSHLGLWRERKGNERGTALLEEPASDADLVYEPVDDAGRVPRNPPIDTTNTRTSAGPNLGSVSESGSGPHFLA
jgi:hypothetical protein